MLATVDAPAVLALLPLAVLPLLRNRRDEIVHPWTAWLPPDRIGRWVAFLWRLLAALTIGCVVVALAGPHRSGSEIERVTRGAEISILLDRSSSMDSTTRRNAPDPSGGGDQPRTKNEIVREALSTLIALRPDNRYALTLFNVAPIRVAPFTDDSAIVQAGLDASGIGRGPSETDIGSALLAAIEAFAGREYSGSRAIVLVSDGGARLEQGVQERVTRALAQQRVALYFVYVRSSQNSPDLETVGTDVGRNIDISLEEVALHLFFQSLDIDYRVFQADDPASMAEAIAEIDSAQNLPLTIREHVPRIGYRRTFAGIAFVGVLVLLGLSAVRVRVGDIA